ncbi:SDR family NAD(P)-dependent oxidoreductase [Phytohabitans sp. ZYX-F-186]|uniref:SDR family NAD(P)-dependent oxidoreductase n=1 Tax=Phytohabitans maris TaxID=3071409 RepID=A0ABU0ZNQ9_9ACTN|nr:SDR family NAD(P)-dependent oxidoreductase [Phytohabitans sp. ZYX-F-186]MDQ7908042.1 SDR family NAD(P)-dependent oxidoreductase [Phytohabitans sp. ZYX-F-186]
MRTPKSELAVVTGASGGIGERIAAGLARTGATVVLVARDRARLDLARERIRAAVPGADLEVEPVDLADLAEVRALADRLADRAPSIVVSNAAVIAPLDDRTPDGFHRALVTNHLAPYLLLRRLAERPAGRPRRFVVVGASPRGLARVPVDFDDLNLEAGRGLGWPPSFRPFVAYARTKNMNAMFVYALASRLAGTGTTVNGAHPGIIKGGGLGREARGALKAFGALCGLFSAGPATGADTPLWLATSTAVEGVTGRFFVKRRAVRTAPHTTAPERVERLWRESARLVGLPAESEAPRSSR